MSNLEKLLDERYPETEISHIQRQAFIYGFNAVLTICETDGDTIEDEALKYAEDITGNEHTIAIQAYFAGAHDFSCATVIHFKNFPTAYDNNKQITF